MNDCVDLLDNNDEVVGTLQISPDEYCDEVEYTFRKIEDDLYSLESDDKDFDIKDIIKWSVLGEMSIEDLQNFLYNLDYNYNYDFDCISPFEDVIDAFEAVDLTTTTLDTLADNGALQDDVYTYTSYGYSQGDVVTIISCYPFTDKQKKYIDNVLWNFPLDLTLNTEDDCLAFGLGYDEDDIDMDDLIYTLYPLVKDKLTEESFKRQVEEFLKNNI